jgi:hypothetical protein
LFCNTARAQTPQVDCAEPRIHLEGELPSTWFEAVTQLCGAFSTMVDIDPNSQLTISCAGNELVVQASTGDGRAAVRRVRQPAELQRKVEALVRLPATLDAAAPTNPTVVPNAIAAPRATSRTAWSSAHAQAASSEPSPASQPATAQIPAPAPPLPLRIELSAAVLGRASVGYGSAGLALYGGLRPGAWLLALALRWEPINEVWTSAPPGFEMDSFAAGFTILRRVLRAQPVELELGAASFLVAERQSYARSVTDRTRTAADVRVGLVVRLLFGESALRWCLWLEPDISPLRVRRDMRLDPQLPRLPAFSLALGLGAAWSES